ncbi:MAG: RNA polymerase factor sigma-54 [Chitinophagales bacterium]|nr:RNA polymerase factor sigma-54 [Chitinophagales bacterium]
MLSQSLSQKMLQKLSPQQIQLMKLLQVPTASLEQRIKEELEVNPALEEGSNDNDFESEGLSEAQETDNEHESEESSSQDEDLGLDDYLDKESYDYREDGDEYSGEDDNKTIPFAVGKSFHDLLYEQLSLLNLDEDEYIIADQIVGSIDDDGYIRREIDAIVDDIAFSRGIMVTEEQVEKVLKDIQRFDPAGVGARDLQECLLIQLKRKNDSKQITKYAILVIENHFEAFTKKHYDKLLKQLNIDESTLKDVVDEILKLNPKPGGSSAGNSIGLHQVIIPDFTLINNNGKLEVLLNGKNAPDLRVSESFKDMIKDYNKSKVKDKKQKEALLFIKQKIDSAKWFIDAIKQRQHTLLVTMNAIVSYQKEYLLTGDEVQMRPMILKDIAEITELDISTISRVANSKYIQTEFGTFLLKHFFSESLQTDSGEEVSTREVKKILENLIDSEDKSKPMSDEQLTEALTEKGYNIARRTVAKYREQLNIPVARLRKEL